MQPFNDMFLLCFYVPATHLETVKAAVFAAGAGRYGNYDQCCWQVLGEGQFRPLANSQAFVGELNQLNHLAEYKVEMLCQAALVKPVIHALLTTHPYQQPAYHLLAMVDPELIV